MTTPNPVVLFLDFDGVLHPFFPLADNTDEDNQHFSYLKNFEQAVRECAQPVEIVVSSTWRKSRTLADLQALFSPDIAAIVVGATPVLEHGNGRGSRQLEVEAWLAANRPNARWVAVDDMPDLFGAQAVVVACHDQFKEREHGLLTMAVNDPQAYVEQHPNVAGGAKRVVRVGA